MRDRSNDTNRSKTTKTAKLILPKSVNEPFGCSSNTVIPTPRNGGQSRRLRRRLAVPPKSCAVEFVKTTAIPANDQVKAMKSDDGPRHWNARCDNCVRPLRSCARHRLFCPGGARVRVQAMKTVGDVQRGHSGGEPICKVLPLAPSTDDRHAGRQADPPLQSARSHSDTLIRNA